MSYQTTFSKVAALIYGFGILSFLGIIAFNFPVQEMPDPFHYIILVLGGYSGIGFLVYHRKVLLSRPFQWVIYWLIAVHLLGSTLLHLYSLLFETNQWITVFPPWYPFLAIAYFSFFAYFSFRLRVKEESPN